MPMTLTNLNLYTRQRYEDTDTGTPAVSDAELLRFHNRNLHWYFGTFSPRWKGETHVALGTQIDAGEPSIFLTPANIAEIKRVYRRTVTGQVTVAGSSVSIGDTACSTINSFATLIPGMVAVHANLPAGTYVMNITGTTTLTLSDKATGEISGANIVFRMVTGVPMRQDDFGRIQSLQQAEATAGVPLFYGFRRARAATVDSVGYMEFAIWPIPDTTYYFPMLLRYEVTELASGSDKLDGSDGDAYTIGDMTAAMAARLLGKDGLADSILAELPQEVRAHMTVTLRTIQPRTSRVVEANA